MKNIQLKLSSRTSTDGNEYWEGTVSFQDLNLAPTKLRKADGCTHFNSRSSVNQAARNLAKKLGCETELLEKNTTKKAAKKSTKTKATTVETTVTNQQPPCTGPCTT